MVEECQSTKPKASTRTLNTACNQILDLLLEEETRTLTTRLGGLFRAGALENQLIDNVPDELKIIDMPGLDIFGEPLYKKNNFECLCPRCHRTLAAARFAPHLEKCMGMGRNSSRIASRRLAASSHSNNSSNANSPLDVPMSSKSSAGAQAEAGASGSHVNGDIISEDEHFEEDEDDEEWTMDKRKKPKKSNEKTSPRKKWAINRLRNAERRGKISGPPSFTNSPASAFSDPGIEDDLDDPMGVPH